MGREARNALCHPERKHKSKGLCSTCYNQQHRAVNREATDEYHRKYREARREELSRAERLRRQESDSPREYQYMRCYGMTVANVRDMLEQQDFSCKICKEEIDEDTKHIDHCHSTGFVRGLLCGGCNRGLGCFKDSKESLKMALAYLDSEPTTFKA